MLIAGVAIVFEIPFTFCLSGFFSPLRPSLTYMFVNWAIFILENDIYEA